MSVQKKFDAKLRKHAANSSKRSKILVKKQTRINKIDRKIKEGNLRMRWGEPVAIIDSSKLDKTVDHLSRYFYSHGWFAAKVRYEVSYRNRRGFVNYYFDNGPRYYIDTIMYNTSDHRIHKIIGANLANSKLIAGTPYNEVSMTQERDRIESLLKNNGYFTFSKQYIRYTVDSTWNKYRVAIRLDILNPAGRKKHSVFTIDSVNFTTDVNTRGQRSGRIKKRFNGINYFDYKDRYSLKVLDKRLFIEPGQLYSRENTLNTQRELARMDIFKFINVSYDTTGNQFKANIFASPLDKYQFSNEAGLSVTQYFPGPFVSASLKRRNIFQVLGIMTIDGRWGIEGVAAASNPDKLLASTEAGGNINFTFPRFFLPVKEARRQQLGIFNPKTSFKAGVTYTQRPEYTRINFTGANSYTWQTKSNVFYDFRLIEIALIRTPFISSDYNSRLQDLENKGNNLIKSFEPSVVTNLSFVRTKNTNNYGTSFGPSSYFSFLIEPGGTFTNLWLSDYLKRQDIETYAYVKFDADYRQYLPTGRRRGFAFRLRSGIGIPYGDNNLLPYEKNFFAGGSISNRAWKPRRLGPGGYNHLDENGEVSYQFEQQGEIIMESSLEYRQRIFGLLQGALFVDAGNIWSLRSDVTRPGAQFKVRNFFRQIAVGAGLGIRLDFSYLLVRFDTSLKVVDPARPVGKRFILSKGFNDPPFDDPLKSEPLVYTIAIGLPF